MYSGIRMTTQGEREQQPLDQLDAVLDRREVLAAGRQAP